MNKYIKIASVAAAAAALLCACSREVAPQTEPEYVDVPFVLNVADAEGDMTRAANALFPEVENWIYDYFYIQFIGDASAFTGHMRKAVTTGDLSVTENIRLRVGANSTVIFVANIVPAGSSYGDNPGWDATDGSVQILDENGVPYTADNENGVLTLNKFKKLRFNMAPRVQLIQSGGNMKHMPMCGYWEGNVPSGSSGTTNSVAATVTMGRMISRMNVNITNNTGSAITKVQLLNAATRAYYFPQVENADLKDADYIDLPAQTVNIANGATETVYFYTAPNYCEDNDKITALKFTAGSKTGSIQLGSDPDQNHYNLYMNTIYTFNITVK